MGLQFLIEVLHRLGPRTTRIIGPTPRPTIIYSDASWPQWVTPEEAVRAGEPPRLGWVICQPGEEPRGFSMELGREFITALFPRKTQILAAEAVAVLAACVLTPELIQGKEIVWFVDNEAPVLPHPRHLKSRRRRPHSGMHASGDVRVLVLGVV